MLKTIEQSTISVYTGISASNKMWQSFKIPGEKGKLVSIRVNLLILSGKVVYTTIFTAGKGTQLGTSVGVVGSGSQQWITYDFTSQKIQFLPDTEYWYRLTANEGDSRGYYQLSEAAYANGQCDAFEGGAWYYGIGDMGFTITYKVGGLLSSIF